MKIIVKNGQVFGLVENEKDLKVLLKAENNVDNPVETTKPPRRSTYRRKKNDRWNKEDEELIMNTIKEEASTTPHAVLFKRIGRQLNRTAGSIAWRFYTLRKTEDANKKLKDSQL